MKRTRTDLLATARRVAAERRAPAATIIKELLHYEILYALVSTGCAERLTFQGGTALRLCYQGSRYSEDLDFVGGDDFSGDSMAVFSSVLAEQIGQVYGLEVEVGETTSVKEGASVEVQRWRTKVKVPQPDPSVQQKHIINIEIASVPAHQRDLVAVQANYPSITLPFSSLIVPTETLDEILADKMLALGARPYLKYRDVWDIKFLLDRGIQPDFSLLGTKVGDYHGNLGAYLKALRDRQAQLQDPATHASFSSEMSRFVDAPVAEQFRTPTTVQRILDRSVRLIGEICDWYGPRVQNDPDDLTLDDGPRF